MFAPALRRPRPDLRNFHRGGSHRRREAGRQGHRPKVGNPAPVFDGTDDLGQDWRAGDHYGKKWVVIYFYPGDFTPGCTAQANAFRDAMNKLTEQGVEVVGVSCDSVRTHDLFKKAHRNLTSPSSLTRTGQWRSSSASQSSRGRKSRPRTRTERRSNSSGT